jgi:hypothetical protein
MLPIQLEINSHWRSSKLLKLKTEDRTAGPPRTGPRHDRQLSIDSSSSRRCMLNFHSCTLQCYGECLINGAAYLSCLVCCTARRIVSDS